MIDARKKGSEPLLLLIKKKERGREAERRGASGILQVPGVWKERRKVREREGWWTGPSTEGSATNHITAREEEEEEEEEVEEEGRHSTGKASMRAVVAYSRSTSIVLQY